MHLTATVVAALASSGIVAALPGDGGWKNKNNGWGEELKTECATSSTCKAQYTTYHETQEKPYTQTVTETVYKPSVIHTQEHSAYPTTIYNTVHVTKTKHVTVHTTIPYKSTSYTTKCYTEPVVISTYSASDVTSEVPYTEEQKQSHVETRTTEVPRDITTSMPYPETKYVTKYEHVTKEVTKPAGEKCETQTTCETKTMGGHGGRGGWGGKGKGGKGWDGKGHH
ncbi:hypothetical protein KC361_g7455 [Hortaea werneckii]|nr:hypothetical protein KC361_g7455 [Hortaea werneckii]KAI7511876.1 hypothetical protein KC347_g2981 [Hortaea werneckii]